MPYIAPEVITEARRMDLLTYLRAYEPNELVRFSGNTYTTRTHDSLKISNGKWMWWSRGIGGNSALDYLVKVKGLSFLEAVETIMGCKVALPTDYCVPQKETPKELKLPPKSASTDRITEYLFSRGIDYEIITHCIQKGLIFESLPYHNAVFVGKDEKGIPRYRTTLNHFFDDYKRHALTIPQQEAFITFCSNSSQYSHWMPLFTVLLGTGCRVGEVIGLRWEDCDFEQNLISVNHNLIYRQQDSGSCEFHITTPKTKAGIRVIPMFQDVKNALTQEYERQQTTGFNQTEIDGYSGFIFSNRYGYVLSPHNINRAIERIVRDHNKQEAEAAEKEQREPALIPRFSVHQLRHTFCTRFCENERDIKVIQEIMGHADISTTMDIYNEATMDRKKQSFANLEGKIKIV